MNFEKKLKEYPFLKSATKISVELGVDLYIVDGFVRDIILEEEKKEIDFLVIGDGPSFATKYAKELGAKNVTIFKNFGTAHFKFNDIDLEFVGARKESYQRGSRKPVVESGTFEDDIT